MRSKPPLRVLDLAQSAGVTDEGLKGVGQLKQLKQLFLPPQITSAGMPHLSGLVELEELSLKESQLTDAGVVHLAKLQNLRKLNLSETKITDEAIPYLLKLKNLRSFDVDGTGMTEETVKFLQTRFDEKYGHYLPISGP